MRHLYDCVPHNSERASCKVHKLRCTGWFPTTLLSVVLVVTVLPAFAGGSAWDEHHTGTPPPPPSPFLSHP